MPKKALALLLLILLLCTACSGGEESPPDFSWSTTAPEETAVSPNALPVNTYVNINLITENNMPVGRKTLTYSGVPLSYRLHLKVECAAEAEVTVFILNNGELLPFSAEGTEGTVQQYTFSVKAGENFEQVLPISFVPSCAPAGECAVISFCAMVSTCRGSDFLDISTVASFDKLITAENAACALPPSGRQNALPAAMQTAADTADSSQRIGAAGDPEFGAVRVEEHNYAVRVQGAPSLYLRPENNMRVLVTANGSFLPAFGGQTFLDVPASGGTIQEFRLDPGAFSPGALYRMNGIYFDPGAYAVGPESSFGDEEDYIDLFTMSDTKYVTVE